MALCGFLPRTPRAVVELDPSQRAVTEDSSGHHLLVVGSPGTGKTTTLIECAARHAAAGHDPNTLVALTASRSAAGALRDRLDARIGQVTTAPLARTVTALAFEIVTAEAARRGTPEPYLLTGAEQDADIADLLAGHVESGRGPAWPEHLSAEVRQLPVFRTELRELMTRLVEHDVAPSTLHEWGERAGRAEWTAAASFIESYRDVVARSREHQLDSAGLVAHALALLARGDVADKTTRNLRLLLVDDLQDATRLTLDFVATLSRRGARVVAFGDPDVASNSFRGGIPDALGRLEAALAPAELDTHLLAQSYRQPVRLHALTRRVTDRIGAAGIVGHRQAQPCERDASVVRVEAPSSARQWAELAHHLRHRHLREGIDWADMAVVVRSGQQVQAALRGLSAASVPAHGTAAGAPLSDESIVRHLLGAVDVAANPEDCTADAMASLVTGPLVGLDRLGLRTLRHALRVEEAVGGGSRSAEDLLREAVSDPAALVTLRGPAARAVKRLAETLTRVRRALEVGQSAEEILWLIWSRSGLEEPWVRTALSGRAAGARADRDLDAVQELFTAAARFTEREPTASADNFFSQVRRAALADDSLSPRALSSAVTVATPPAVVGREFSTVAVASLQEGTWPDVRVRGTLLGVSELSARLRGDDPATLDERRAIIHDELRLFALAVSRARDEVVLSCVASEDQQPSPLLTLAGRDAPTNDQASATAERMPLTLRGVAGHLRRILTDPAGDETRRSEAASALARLADHGVPGADPSTWHGIAAPTTSAPLFDGEDVVPVSPSKMESCEKSPSDWFVDWVSLGRSTTAMAVGTLVHAAMDEADDTSFDAVWEVITRRWHELEFEADWAGERKRNEVRVWAAALAAYLTACREAGVSVAAREHPFTVPFDGASLNGFIDRVEVDPDGGVRIVDLKTGTAIPKPEVPENAQLLAYQLAYATGALDEVLSDTAHHHAAGARLLYVKDPKKAQRYSTREQEASTPEQLADFRDRVRRVVDVMRQAEFTGPAAPTEHRLDDASPQRLHRVKAVCSD